MYQLRYVLEYPNGGWKYFNTTFKDKDLFITFFRAIRDDRRCIAYTFINERGIKKMGEKINGRWVKSVEA
jgi:hypothetical protein